MNRYTIRDFKYGDTECPMSKLQDLENKIEDGVLVKASDIALETVDDFQSKLRNIFINMCEGNDYNTVNLLAIDGAIEALHDAFVAELQKKYESEGNK